MNDRKKILLIRPPTITGKLSFIASQFPLNIALLAAVLLKNGYEARLIDYDVEIFERAKFKRYLTEFNPDIIGLSCFTPNIIEGHKIAVLAKEILPQSLIVVGGPHVSGLPEETLREFKGFDIGVVGEGEETILDICHSFFSEDSFDGIKGVVYRKNGTVLFTGKKPPIDDMDSLPFPARELLNIDLYKGQSHRGFSRDFLKITELMTSRGCPNSCIFCASDVVMGKGVRFRSAGSVKDEIRECVGRFKFDHFTISDDTFTLKKDRLCEICDEFSKFKVTWNCNARVWPISKEILKKMADSGCSGITFGVESGSPRILKLIKKNITVGQIEDAFRWSKEAGIKLVEADIIIGSHPSETMEDIKMTQMLLKRISPDVAMISVVIPYPGTELYTMMKEKGLIFNSNKWDEFLLYGGRPQWRTENFMPDKLLSIQKKMLFGFYIRPSYIIRTIAKMNSIKEFCYWINGGLGFLRYNLKHV